MLKPFGEICRGIRQELGFCVIQPLESDIAAILMKDEFSWPSPIIGPGKFKLRVHDFRKEHGFRFGKDRDGRLITQLGEELMILQGDEHIGPGWHFVRAGITAQGLGIERNLLMSRVLPEAEARENNEKRESRRHNPIYRFPRGETRAGRPEMRKPAERADPSRRSGLDAEEDCGDRRLCSFSAAGAHFRRCSSRARLDQKYRVVESD
ncbi:MAG TPA: hypothetical protein VMB85_09375 [Bryobacteraceae bacterium]|nr:hypothetical protein [Bryobacteraceae bacterium]